MRDLEVQKKYGVDYRQDWFDETTGKVFCLVEAHGLGADEIVEVRMGS